MTDENLSRQVMFPLDAIWMIWQVIKLLLLYKNVRFFLYYDLLVMCT